MTVVIKLGGSVITVKDRPETVDESALDRAVEAVAGVDGELVLVHGGGGFGHPRAEALGISRTAGSHDAAGLYDVHDAMTRLNAAVLGRLHDRGVPALPLHPLSSVRRGAAGDLELPTAVIDTMLSEGFVPVLHGDVIAHRGVGGTVLSGDELVAAVARAVSAARVGICTGVPGVLDGNGDVIERIESFDAVADVLTETEATDVTGGMAAKVRTLLELGTPAYVFGLVDLPSFVAGGRPGTRIG